MDVSRSGWRLADMNISRIEDKFIVISEPADVPVYDFNFDLHFRCTHPQSFNEEELCVLRVGAIPDYRSEFSAKADLGLRLINSPSEHARASELDVWYPRLADLTPRTRVFAQLPAVEEIEATFTWPVFIKGSRQTSKHNPDLSIARDATQYRQISNAYLSDPILHWQKPVVREFVPLRRVPGQVPGKIMPSLEFRSFWWHGECVGWGEYWYQVPRYQTDDIETGLGVAEEAARRLEIPFLVVDFAKTADSRWILIECNDAQESGYAAIPAQALWRNVLKLT
jgi:hypothetical protein